MKISVKNKKITEETFIAKEVALIAGITGQDSAYLAEFLFKKDMELELRGGLCFFS